MINGWDLVLPTMAIGERAIVRITDPELGYGAEGFPPLIPPNSEIEIDVEVIDAEQQRGISLDEMLVNPSTPVRRDRDILLCVSWYLNHALYRERRRTLLPPTISSWRRRPWNPPKRRGSRDC